MSKNNLIDLAEVSEAVDNGRRLALVEATQEAEAHERPAADTSPDLEQEVADLSAALRIVESKAAYLAGAVDETSLASAVVGSVGLAIAEVREQVPVLRAAVRDAEAGR